MGTPVDSCERRFRKGLPTFVVDSSLAAAEGSWFRSRRAAGSSRGQARWYSMCPQQVPGHSLDVPGNWSEVYQEGQGRPEQS